MLAAADALVAKFVESLRGLNDEELEALAYRSPAVHFASYVRIRDKNNEWCDPVPNILQLRMSEAYETMIAMGAKVRIIGVKPRRAGCSSFASHVVYHHAMRHPIKGITISDIKKNSGMLMAKLKGYSQNDRYPWDNELIPTAGNILRWSNGTEWEIESAENPDAGVGDTRQAGHFSEVSKWPQTERKNDKKTMGAVLPSLSGSDTVVFAESTPEGAMGWQYQTWCEAVTLEEFIRMYEAGIRPEEQWVKVFAAWFEFHDNQRTQPVSEREIDDIKRSLTHRERNGIDKYQWTWEQVAWRRDTVKAVCNGDEKMFDYYYPEDEISCWTASGAPRFDMPTLCDMEQRAKGSSPQIGYLVTQQSGRVGFAAHHDGSGDIVIWEEPVEGRRYCVACDPATDASQTIGADPDRHSISVWRGAYYDREQDCTFPMKMVARVRYPYYADGDEVAGHIVRLSKHFGNAMVGIEVNCGLDILRLVRLAGVPVYKRHALSHRTQETVEQYGFRLNDKQERNAVIEGLAAAIRNRDIEVLCQDTIKEYKSFVVKPDGRAEAARNAHDDDVMSSALAWEVMPSAGEFKRQVSKLQDPPDLHTWKRVAHNW